MSRKPYKGRDPFGERARAEGYEARSVYKLQEIQQRHGILARGQRVVDLGCFPGSWSQLAARLVGQKGRVVGVDLKTPVVGGAIWLEGSVYDVSPEALVEALGGPADAVLSDMAPKTTGDRFGDHVQQIELARRALFLATSILAPGGSFVCKVFEGEDAKAFELEARRAFAKVKRARPQAVRKVSREWFLVATGYRSG